jgi:hypothetical protein
MGAGAADGTIFGGAILKTDSAPSTQGRPDSRMHGCLQTGTAEESERPHGQPAVSGAWPPQWLGQLEPRRRPLWVIRFGAVSAAAQGNEHHRTRIW